MLGCNCLIEKISYYSAIETHVREQFIIDFLNGCKRKKNVSLDLLPWKEQIILWDPCRNNRACDIYLLKEL